MNCTCTNGQGPPPAAKRPGCGEPFGTRSSRSEPHTSSAPRCRPGTDGYPKPRANRGCIRPVSVCESGRAWERDSVQSSATYFEERRAVRIARVGRKLPGERGMGGAFGFVDQDACEDRARPQDCIALLRKAWPCGNDLRAAGRGTG